MRISMEDYVLLLEGEGAEDSEESERMERKGKRRAAEHCFLHVSDATCINNLFFFSAPGKAWSIDTLSAQLSVEQSRLCGI